MTLEYRSEEKILTFWAIFISFRARIGVRPTLLTPVLLLIQSRWCHPLIYAEKPVFLVAVTWQRTPNVPAALNELLGDISSKNVKKRFRADTRPHTLMTMVQHVLNSHSTQLRDRFEPLQFF